MVLKRTVHRFGHGKKWDVEAVMISGYVFVFVPLKYDIRLIRSDNNPYKVLRSKLDCGKLFEDDYRYSLWVLQ